MTTGLNIKLTSRTIVCCIIDASQYTIQHAVQGSGYE